MDTKTSWEVKINHVGKKIIVTPKPKGSIKRFFIMRSEHFRIQEIEYLKKIKQDQKKASGKVSADLVKGISEYGLPHIGQFKVTKITPKRVFIEQVGYKGKKTVA